MRLPKLEADNNPVDIDSFTIFCLFNKGITNANTHSDSSKKAFIGVYDVASQQKGVKWNLTKYWRF